MKNRFLILLICLTAGLAMTLSACGTRPQPSYREAEGENKLRVVTTLFPAYDFVRELGKDRCEITLLVPPGAEAHSFEPTAQDLIRIENCDVLVCNGGESEVWLETLLSGTTGDFALVRMLDCVEALEEEEKEGMQDTHEEEDEDGPEFDEHVWTSPRNARIICEAICQALCERDSEGEALYRENLERYDGELEALDAAFRQIVAQAHNRCLIFADRFPVRYFVEEYGLDYFAAFPGCADDTEPSARTVAFLIDRVREEGLDAVLYIEYSNQKMADVICEDTGCEKLLFHSCHTVSADDLARGATYLSLMWDNTKSVKEALG